MAAAAAIALGGCGGDDEPEPVATTAPTDVARSTTVPPASDTTEQTTTEESTTEEEKPRRKRKKRGESGEGGAGDEEEARTEVRITGRGGKVKPTDIKVAPFIGVRVILRSRDDHTYFVTFGNEGGFAPPRKSTQFVLDGLRTGDTREGRYMVDGKVEGEVRITATSEPGP